MQVRQAARGGGEMKVVYCPLHTATMCGYWSTFGGHLDPFMKGFKTHIRKDHSEAGAANVRNVGGVVDRWIGDTLVNQYGRTKEETP